MGADIHTFIEYAYVRESDDERPESWYSFGGRINPSRDYEMFALLANVRGIGALYPPRGVPDQLSWTTRDAFYMTVLHEPRLDFANNPLPAEEGEVSAETAAGWVARGYSRYEGTDPTTGRPLRITHPDWHSPSWLTLSEFDRVLAAHKRNTIGGRVHPGWLALRAALKAFDDAPGFKARLVFWFDN